MLGLVEVTISELKSDTYMQTALLYDIKVDVLDEGGNSLATNQIKGKDNLGNLGLTPDAGVALGFASKLDQLFDNDKIIAALKSRRSVHAAPGREPK